MVTAGNIVYFGHCSIHLFVATKPIDSVCGISTSVRTYKLTNKEPRTHAHTHTHTHKHKITYTPAQPLLCIYSHRITSYTPLLFLSQLPLPLRQAVRCGNTPALRVQGGVSELEPYFKASRTAGSRGKLRRSCPTQLGL